MRPDSYRTKAAGWDPYVEEGGNQNNNNFSFKDNAIAIVGLVLAAFAFAAALFFYSQAVEAERETRLLEYYVMELDGKLMKQRIIEPEESWSARKPKEK